MELAITLLRGIYLLSLAAVVGCMTIRAQRVFTSRAQRDDLPCLIFWGLAVNRVWFLFRGAHFGQPIDQPYEGETLIACYVFAILFEALACIWWWWLRSGEHK